MKKFLAFAVAALSLVSCKKESDNQKNGIFKGPEVKVHEGKAWTWVQLNDAGNPERIAVTLTDQALSSVPVGSGDNHGHMDGNHWILKLHPKAAGTPFNHVGMHWNPNGHEPANVYTLPHFDFHFYLSTPEEVAAIPPYPVDSMKFKNVPGPDYLPATYINPGAATSVPQMGAHWIDVTSPELGGQTFTQTLLYGSYDGKVTFLEPMITLQFLKNTNSFVRDIPLPAKVHKTSWYPTKMRVVKRDGLTEVIYEGMVFRQQS